MTRIPILATVFTLALSAFAQASQSNHPIWHPLSLSFSGPETSETAAVNPFTDYRLLVRFTHPESESELWIRGFYAADGNAAQTSADSGNVWQASFTPDRVGEWTFEARLSAGTMIAIDDDPDSGKPVAIQNASGSINVIPTPSSASGFLARGRIEADRHTGYFRLQDSDTYWLKGGADSPENLLAYADFDGTYRHSGEHREGESRPTESLHRYEPHLKDWRVGDPTWQNGKGKGLIGALNYLAATGMNAVYFLTMNIGGDGKDVWPYLSHDDFTRFDCSKLAQWDIVFQHAQRNGILLHVVTQETENERLLDDGDTDTYRKLYYRELIARFAHHPAIVWNLGEENGPADFSPNGQSSAQQRAMATYLKSSDPYKNSVVIHTHSVDTQKDELLPALLGHEPLDGLSFQVNEPAQVHSETKKWIRKSIESGHRWLIAMDEIGPWQIGVPHDADDPNHDSLRRHVLWGSLMAGAAGVEWYFGAHQQGNDLTTEDWRSRANMWAQTRHALAFFEDYLPYWKMRPADELTPDPNDYCYALPGELYAIYSPDGSDVRLDLETAQDSFEIHWFSPKRGGDLQIGSVAQVSGPGAPALGSPPASSGAGEDWIILVRRQTETR